MENEKQQEKIQLAVILLVAGIGYYFFAYLDNKRNNAKVEIKKLLQSTPSVSPNDLDGNLWESATNWEEYLESLYLTSQINQFTQKMKNAIKDKQKKLEEERANKKKVRQDAIEQIEKISKEVFGDMEKELPSIQKAIKDFTKKINKSRLDDISSVVEEAQKFLYGERDKIKRLYWNLPDHNWADRWLKRNKESFVTAWNQMKSNLGEEPAYFNAKAIYKISFPLSLWNELTNKQRELAKKEGHNELELRDEVSEYKFNDLIEEWEDKVRPNPVRGEQDPKNPAELDNNALFYGAPRTGKSIMAEKLAYEADVYPLVTIQGSTLTPRKVDTDASVTLLLKFIFTISSITHDLVNNYGFERAEGDGEVRYILFIDEADQICTNNFDPPRYASSQLTFLKECMGSDNKTEESKNLWIAATNHLDNINEAVYQSGRLSNALSFSWTLGTFLYYAEQEGITSDFPQHWLESKTLNAEDIKFVNRFNKILFDKFFLGKGKNGTIDYEKSFWQKFIQNPDTKEQLPEIKEFKNNEITGEEEEIVKQKGIQWGEMLEFFWQKFDNNEIGSDFDGKFVKPQKPKIEEIVEESVKLAANKIATDIGKAIDIRLRELKEVANETKEEIESGQESIATAISQSIEELTSLMAEMKRK